MKELEGGAIEEWATRGKAANIEIFFIYVSFELELFENNLRMFYFFLDAGSAAFSNSNQLIGELGVFGSLVHILILCDWKTAWSLLFKPIEKSEREKIKEELKVILFTFAFKNNNF